MVTSSRFLNLFTLLILVTCGKLFFKYNMELAKERAIAVVTTVVRDYGVAPDRLDAHGVGPLAPVTTNKLDEGRAQNRRVELVAR